MSNAGSEPPHDEECFPTEGIRTTDPRDDYIDRIYMVLVPFLLLMRYRMYNRHLLIQILFFSKIARVRMYSSSF